MLCYQTYTYLHAFFVVSFFSALPPQASHIGGEIYEANFILEPQKL